MNSGDGYILTIDCGTQSVRAILFNSRGSIVGKEKVEFEPYFSTQPGWAEQHADVFWDNACKACQTLKAQQPEDWNKIVGVTVTTQRDTTVLIDKEGQPLRPAIIWLDQRMAQCREPLPLHHQIMFKAVGMSKTLELIRRQTKTNWIRENEPELWEKTYKCLLLSGYFIFQLTGRYADSVGSQIGHIPFDYKRQCWAKPLDFKWPLFGIEREKLYDLAKPGEPIAPITAQAASATGIKEGTPVIAAEKGGYEHFMLKEIHEQPVAVRQTLQGRIKDGRVDLADLELDDLFQGINKIYMVACGTAYHAGMVGRLAIEKLARIPVETDIASEFRYRDIIWKPDELMIVISQSGETADTLSALRYAKRNGIKVLAVTNVVGSSVAREADKVIYTHAGPEIAVASTKAYTTQLVIMYLLALYLAQERGTVPPEELRKLVDELASMDEVLEEALQQEEKIKAIAARYTHVQHTFFLGRGFDNAVAMEGALKLKETSYIHAEAYAAGELKHGPLALISDGVPVLTVITQDSLVDKTMSNIKEVKARGAVVIAICKENLQEDCQECDEILLIPNVNSILAPVAAVVPLQTFAYYMSVLRGNDVDKPRNLAKSVTVE
jgi:glucosamine--fructose-6-phosphate aminotransferase (isomerizing)